MPFNGSGAFVPLSRPTYPPQDGELIQASLFKAVIDDLIGGLNACLTRDGVGGPSGNLAMGGKKHTGAAPGSSAGDYITWGQNASLGALTLAGGQLNFTGTAGGPQTSWRPAADAPTAANYHVFRHADGTAIGYLGSDGGAVIGGGSGKGFAVRGEENLQLLWQGGYSVLKGQDGEVSLSSPTAPYARYKVYNSTALLELGVTTNAKVLSTKSIYIQTPAGDFIVPETAGALTWRGQTVWTAENFTPGNYALTSHNHDSAYAAATHNHDAAYATVGHNHTGVYQPAGSYAAATHNHDSVYQPLGSYAAASHNHDAVYAKLSSAPTFTGLVYGRGGGSGLGQIQVSTSAPSGGADGDLWLVY